MTLTDRKAIRQERAAQQAADYDFHLSQVNGVAVVFVIACTPRRDGSQPIYTVHSGSRCSCPDFQQRGQHQGIPCKHIHLANAWLSDCDTPELPEAAEAPTQVCAGCGSPKEGRMCPTCGSAAIISPSLPVDPARETRKRELLALWP